MLIPLLFMHDVVGRLFREFAMTLAVTILISAVGLADAGADDVRQAAAPPPAAEERRGWRAAAAGLVRRADRAVRHAADLGARSPAADACWSRVGTLVLTILLYVAIPKGFFPVQDTGLIQGISEARRQFLCRHGRAAAGARRTPSSRIPTS